MTVIETLKNLSSLRKISKPAGWKNRLNATIWELSLCWRQLVASIWDAIFRMKYQAIRVKTFKNRSRHQFSFWILNILSWIGHFRYICHELKYFFGEFGNISTTHMRLYWFWKMSSDDFCHVSFASFITVYSFHFEKLSFRGYFVSLSV